MSNEKQITVTVLSPSGTKPKTLTQEDVWGRWEDGNLISRGMIVAQGYPNYDTFKESCKEYQRWKETVQVDTFCPVWNDRLPYKSVTVICDQDQEEDVSYWLDYVHGGGISRTKVLDDGRLAIRSNYMCW